ncbi:hypothetical protein DPEC_G00181720 [Dallia pectoralis]|uniref:Uncharacterized protein n=1 Tax=Dallia pectoralis TaxID=75939 RepID=A0ACC2GAE4_DALPE|nr:hypothetical protein DPEC_G00181720 [Dallia pectoralis]
MYFPILPRPSGDQTSKSVGRTCTISALETSSSPGWRMPTPDHGWIKVDRRTEDRHPSITDPADRFCWSRWLCRHAESSGRPGGPRSEPRSEWRDLSICRRPPSSACPSAVVRRRPLVHLPSSAGPR